MWTDSGFWSAKFLPNLDRSGFQLYFWPIKNPDKKSPTLFSARKKRELLLKLSKEKSRNLKVSASLFATKERKIFIKRP